MVGVLFELKDLKWLVRIGLIIFFIFGFYLEIFQSHPFFYYMVKDHHSFTLFIVFLTSISFLGFIVPKPKKKIEGGGEVAMKRLHIIIIVVLTLLIALVFALANYHEETTAWLNSIGGGVGASIVTAFSGFNTALRSYEPYQVMLGSIIGGIVFAWMLFFVFAPKVKNKLRPTAVQPTSYMGEPSVAPPTPIKPASKTVVTPPAEEQKSE